MLHMMYWSESCACHQNKGFHISMLADLGRRDHRGASGKRRACPMSGRRAPELAAGALLQCMDELWDTHSASLLVQHSRHLSHTDKLRVFGRLGIGPSSLPLLRHSQARAMAELTALLVRDRSYGHRSSQEMRCRFAVCD